MKRRQIGFTLVEIIIVLALIGTAISGVMYYMSKAEESNKTNNAINAIISMAGSIKSAFSPAASYVAVTNTALNNMGLVDRPFTGSGNTITTPWGSSMTVDGDANFFRFVIPAPNKSVCSDLLSKVAANATKAAVGSSAVAINAAETSFNVLNRVNNTAYNPDAVSTGCSGATPTITLLFR